MRCLATPAAMWVGDDITCKLRPHPVCCCRQTMWCLGLGQGRVPRSLSSGLGPCPSRSHSQMAATCLPAPPPAHALAYVPISGQAGGESPAAEARPGQLGFGQGSATPCQLPVPSGIWGLLLSPPEAPCKVMLLSLLTVGPLPRPACGTRAGLWLWHHPRRCQVWLLKCTRVHHGFFVCLNSLGARRAVCSQGASSEPEASPDHCHLLGFLLLP